MLTEGAIGEPVKLAKAVGEEKIHAREEFEEVMGKFFK